MDGPDVIRHPLVRAVATGLRRHCGVREGDSVLVAVSGGADSVALLRALTGLAPRRTWGLRLVVGHVQHHLRGDDGEADAAFVARLAGELSLSFGRRDVQPTAAPGNVEANARQLRYRALVEIAAEHDCPLVATAHHGDDQLETLLMRLVRGTTVAGMRGIAWERGLPRLDPQSDREPFRRLVRPMLGATHADAVDLLTVLGQRWREDATNADASRTRARLRRDVLPVLRELRGDAAAKAQQFADHCQEAAKLQADADAMFDVFMRPIEFGYRIRREVLQAMDEPTARRVLHRMLVRCSVSRGTASGEALEQFVRAARDRSGKERHFTFGPILAGVQGSVVFAGWPIM